MKEENEFKISSCYPRGLEASSKAYFSACGVFADDSASGGCLLFYCRVKLLRDNGVRFEKTCTVSGK